MSSSVSEANLEKKFQSATNTQDSIQTLSLWLLHHKAHHQKIVAAWMKVLKKAKISHRLTLFYLANDVVQNGKRKGFLQFGTSFAEVLREATLLVRDEKIRPAVQRVFTIWEQRSIYTPEFIADLRAILANTKVPATAHSKLLSEFEPNKVIEKLRLVMKVEMDVATKKSTLNLTKLNATNAEIVQKLKDRTHGQKFKQEFDENARCLEELIKLATKEVKERNELILLLEQSEIYYDTQRGEAKIVANAYKNFGGRVKALQKKLEELKASFPSPVPSPCPDAPSPTSEHELELKLPNDQTQATELENLENAPSPEGTPEGLNIPSEEPPKPVTTSQSVGNPIPTLSNFFSHDQSGMPSWLDTFTKSKPASSVAKQEQPEAPKKDPSSLDSRLSNLLQNIPNLPSGLQNSIFGNSSSSNTPAQDGNNSPATLKKEEESTPPVKDDYSGQNTPLQDEESSHSNPAFFTKVTSAPKPTDILSSLIKSVSSDKPDTSYKNEYSYSSPDTFNQTAMPSFIQKIIPSVPSIPQSMSPSYFNPVHPQPVSMEQPVSTNSYETAPYLNMPVYSSKNLEDPESSFIPSLVPLPTQDNQYNYSEYSTNNYNPHEYNPEMEMFDDDMDLDNELCGQSPAMDAMSPVPSPEIPELLRPQDKRFSTLITVVTKDSPEPSLPPPNEVNESKSDKENGAEVPQWNASEPPLKADSPWTNNKEPPVEQKAPPVSSPEEGNFFGKEPGEMPSFFSQPPPSIEQKPLNGRNMNYGETNNAGNPRHCPPHNFSMNRREPNFHPPRENTRGDWIENHHEDERMPFTPRGPRGPPPSMQRTPYFEKRHHGPDHFPRNDWRPNFRARHQDQPYHRPFRPMMGPRPRENRPPFNRGRGPRHFRPHF